MIDGESMVSFVGSGKEGYEIIEYQEVSMPSDKRYLLYEGTFLGLRLTFHDISIFWFFLDDTVLQFSNP